MPEFSFIFDARIRKILERDYGELQQLNSRTSTKAVIVLSGGIIEGLLVDALVASGKWTFDEACQNYLKDMIGPAKTRGIITEDRLTDVTRKYRNLIHPGREIKEQIVFDENDAVLARTAVDIAVRDVRKWATTEQKRRQLRRFLTQLNEDEVKLLQLFASPLGSDSHQFEHPFLSHSVYRSTESLTANGVLTKEVIGELGEHKERVSLVPEAVELIEELVVKSGVQRSSIIFDYRNIAASGAGGSGAPPTGMQPISRRPLEIDAAPSSDTFPATIEINLHQAVVEKSTEVVIALHYVSQSRQALLTITLPGKEPQQFPDSVAGNIWRFERSGKRYRMTLLEVSYIKDRAKLEVRLDPDAV